MIPWQSFVGGSYGGMLAAWIQKFAPGVFWRVAAIWRVGKFCRRSEHMTVAVAGIRRRRIFWFDRIGIRREYFFWRADIIHSLGILALSINAFHLAISLVTKVRMPSDVLRFCSMPRS